MVVRQSRATQPPPREPSSSWTPQRLLSSSYKDLGSPQQVTSSFRSHLLTSSGCLSSLLRILFVETGKTGVYDHSVPIDMHDFLQSDPVLGNMLLRFPGTLLPLLEDAIVSAQKEMMKRIETFHGIYHRQQQQHDQQSNHHPGHPPKSNATVKGEHGTRVHARLVNLPPHSTNVKPSLSSLTSTDVGKILQLSGTVTRASTVQMYESQRAFLCKGSGSGKGKNQGCGASFVVKADLQCHNNALVHPTRCPTQGCKSKAFSIVEDAHQHNRSDYQEIKVQESISISQKKNHTGAIPRALLIKLQHDLVDSCQPGDDVVIVGTLMSHWQPLVMMGEVNIGMAIHAHSVRVVHGGGSGDGASSGGSGSSWDYIFDGNRNVDDADDHTIVEEKKDGGNLHGSGMVKEEIVKEFSAFWEENANRMRPIATRNFICQAVCPTLYGLSLVKLALLLTLIGGSHSGQNGAKHEASSANTNELHTGEDDPEFPANDSFSDKEDTPVMFSLLGDDDTSSSQTTRNTSFNSRNKKLQQNNNPNTSGTVQTRRREQSHMLLVGDPGCGKSQFLRFAAALCPRSVLTSGSGTTSAGLTCAAIRDDTSKEFTLEAGALVLADRGVCAIDEFSCIKPADRTTIHEAMEQQTLSVAKAGIVCKLNCRATVIAVTNAKGGIYDHEKPFTVNVGIEPPLLSRFDLIFKLIDGSDAAKDDNVATFLLNRAIQGAGYECSKSSSLLSGRLHWNIDKLRAYVATVKSCFHPRISTDASLLLERHYTECRSSEHIEVQVTVRLLESLIRLAQAHARLMFRNVVELDDAVAIILLMECTVASTSASSFQSLYVDPATALFPADDVADVQFVLNKMKVLQKYHMLDRLTSDERSLIEDHTPVTVPSAKGFYEPHINGGGGWDDIETTNSNQYIGPPPHMTPGKQNHYSPSFATNEVAKTSQDHYGRFTQKATPSPSFTIPRDCMQNDSTNYITSAEDPSRKRRKRHNSAD